MIRKGYFFVLFFAVFTLFLPCRSNGEVPGNIDGSDTVDLKDAVIALQFDSGTIPVSATFDLDADVNNDKRLGVLEAVFDLQVISDARFLLDFNYNEDGSGVRTLSGEAVNEYEKVQERLTNHINTNDELSFNTVFELYVNDLLENSFPVDEIPSYAPRGNARKITIDVTSGKIDYSTYILKGDIDLDATVDFSDLEALKTALFNQLSDAKYDINSDTVVDVRDIIFLVARIGTEICYFDFYTTAGEKLLTIPTRTVSDPRVFDYTGPETQVMAVPKDINRASGFESFLDDIEDVWYKKPGWVFQEGSFVTSDITANPLQENAAARRSATRKPLDETGKGEIIKSTLEKLIDFEKVKTTPHLVGWHLDVRYVNTGTFKALDAYGMDGSVSYIQPFEDRIRTPHFAKTTMMTDKRAVTKIAYVLHLGIESDPLHIEAFRQPITGNLIKDGETVVVRQIIQAASITFTSREEHVLSGDLMGSNNTLQGEITLSRIGPYPEEKDFGSVETINGNFQFPDLPYGAYNIEFENKCGCPTEVANSFIFKTEETNIFEVEETAKNVMVGLTIVDGAGDPLVNTAISITSAACVSEESSASGTTNETGFVDFNDMPIGRYDVSADGKKVGSITFCDNYNTTIVVSANPLWKFSVAYTSPYGNGTITARDVLIDFDAQADPGGTIVYALAGSTCSGDLYGCGQFAIYNDLFVNPGSKWISFDSMIVIDPESHLEGEMISAEIDYGMNGLVCDGHIPEGFSADSGTTTWSYGNGFSSWTLTLEPCAPGGCD